MTGWAPLLHTYISGLWHQTTIDVPHRVWMLLYDTPLVYLSLVGLSSRSCAEFNKGNWSPVVNLTAQMCCLFHHTAAAAAAHHPYLHLTWQLLRSSTIRSQFWMFYNCLGVDYINHWTDSKEGTSRRVSHPTTPMHNSRASNLKNIKCKRVSCPPPPPSHLRWFRSSWRLFSSPYIISPQLIHPLNVGDRVM